MLDLSLELREFRNRLGKSQRQIAEDCGIPQTTWANYESAKASPSKKVLSKLAEWGFSLSGLDLEKLSKSEIQKKIEIARAVSKIEPSDRLFRLPLLKQKVSCGQGIDWNSEENIEEHITLSSFIKHLDTKNAVCYKVAGSSMRGAGINDGDYVVSIFSHDIVLSDGVYIIALDGEVYCKRLEYDLATEKVYIFSERFPYLDKAELITTISKDDKDRLFIFGKVKLVVRPMKD